ncbi:MAG TPA: hypothetical protein ENN88_02815, partial [Candidatus Coatesbacteria bacterium]|nr:hypothetical protein [Candidatus Coatesbacteria bacterium]
MKTVVLPAALCLALLTACRSEEGLPAVRVSFEGGYSEIARGSYSLTPAADGDSVEFRYEEEDLRGYSLQYGKTLSRAELEEVYRIFAENEIARLPSSDLATATDLHTYTVTVREGDREHTFSVYGPHRHPDGRYWNVIAPLAELAERLG